MELTRLDWGENRSNACKLGVKVARVRSTLDLGQERRLNSLVVDVVPVDVAEEGLAHDLLRVGRAASKSLVGFSGEEFLKNGNGIPRHVNRVEGFISQNGVVNLVFVFTSEGRLLQKHLVDQDAKSPPVDCAAILFVQQNLVGWCQHLFQR